MFDGSIKSVEDINPGDYLMGQDSSARKVLSIHSGQDNLFKIKQRGGIDYVVNSKHILSLKKTGDVNYSIHSGKITSKRYSKGKVINVSVKDYVSSSKKFKHKHKGYMVGVNYKASNLPIPARLLGIWLGDGTSAKPQITTNDSEIENYIKDYARTCNMFTTEYFNTPKCKSISIVQRVGHGGDRKYNKNKFLKYLQDKNLINNKHIPQEYLINSSKNRLELLAGLIDTDGWKNGHSGCYFTNTNERLAKDVYFLARSLGFYASIKEYTAKLKSRNYKCQSYRVYINGDIYKIPLLLARKRQNKKTMRTNPTTWNISVEQLGTGDYFGFELDGDGLFLLEDFTVTHNSALALQLAWDVSKQGIPVLFLSLEMYEEDVIERLFCLSQKVDNFELLKGNFDLYQKHWENFKTELDGKPLVITDMLGKTWQEIDEYLQTLTAKPKVIIIDHLQEAKSALLKNQKEVIEEYLKKLRLMAIRDNFSLIICSQINRASQDDKVGAEPQLHNLKQSGYIEECVFEDTLIQNIEDMKSYEIKDIFKKQFFFPIKMIDLKTAKIVYSKPNKILDMGIKDCYKITTESGKEIIVSDTTQFYNGKWKTMKNIKEGDYIYVDY